MVNNTKMILVCVNVIKFTVHIKFIYYYDIYDFVYFYGTLNITCVNDCT